MRLIIDADPIVYRSGFAAEKTAYHFVAEDLEGKLYERYFEPDNEKTALQKATDWMKFYEMTELSREKVVLPEPVEHALYLVKQELTGIVDRVQGSYAPKGATSHVLLSGPGNFREKIAKQKPYKGNRDPSHVPYHYQAIRDYMTAQWGARVISGRESDDEASILAHRALAEGVPYVIATIDKDLDQVPGLHYDYKRKVFYDVSPEEGRKVFWTQLLSGDPTDNIPGCYRMGPAKAGKIVSLLMDEDAWDAEDMWRMVVGEYKASTRYAGCPYKLEDAETVALETARLVYMQRRENELWNPPGVPMGTIEGGIDD